MMKTPFLLALGAVAALAGVANAQIIPNDGDGFQLRDIPDTNGLFRAPITPVPSEEQSLFGPDMPPRPKIPAWDNVKLKLSILKSPKGDVFQLEVNGQSRAAIVKKITDVMGVRAIIDPQLEKKIEITQVFRGLSWDELLASVNYGIEMVKSPSGTYFFADAPIAPLTLKIPLYYDSRDPTSPNLAKQLHSGPFVYEINPGYQPPQPQPDWEKREFNGHEFYYVPAPATP